MPKKFSTEHPKAKLARERKEETKNAIEKQKQQSIEDDYWRDENKILRKKMERKVKVEQKKEVQQMKKVEAKQLLESEMESLTNKGTREPSLKVTRTSIGRHLSSYPVTVIKKPSIIMPEALEENLNRMGMNDEAAHNIDDAIQILKDPSKVVDRHPEKRQKAAYLAYEERRVAELKLAHPTFRLSQIKELIFKEWQKSPENPLSGNQL